MSNPSDCGCRTASPLPAGPTASSAPPAGEPCGCAPGVSLAIVTVPLQPWETPYEPAEALQRGTIFPSLDKPFFAAGGDLLGR